ncbi:MAG: biopolymer transporter ExbD [Phycisphaerales bacterium]|jgi:biopolymer transport protein ExbD|nr:biopolymer transporter ExbD [Phycisphaerales bacterium]
MSFGHATSASSSSGGGFRRRTARDVATLHYGPNMTPMVDVVMVILVFFMVSAAFIGPEWLLRGLVPRQVSGAAAGASQTQSPSAANNPSADPLATSPVRFTIDLAIAPPPRGILATGAGVREGSIDAVMEALGRQIAAAGGTPDQIEVLIRPGPGVPWGPVVRVHELARKMGIVRVGPQTGGGRAAESR